MQDGTYVVKVKGGKVSPPKRIEGKVIDIDEALLMYSCPLEVDTYEAAEAATFALNHISKFLREYPAIK